MREDNKNTGSQTPNQAPKTGDGANVATWFVLCMACVTLVLFTKKKGIMAS